MERVVALLYKPNMLTTVQAMLGAFYSKWPVLASISFFATWALVATPTWFFLMVRPSHATAKEDQAEVPGQSIQDVSGSSVYQAGRDIVIGGGSADAKIYQLALESRLTTTLKAGAELPPAEAPFIPIGGGTAILEGPAGKIRLDFQSPAVFRRVDGDKIITINRFAMSGASDLIGRPLDALKGYEKAVVPVLTIIYGKSFDQMTLYEASLIANGEIIWSYRYDLNAAFQEGPEFKIPLTELRLRR
jgi:hypothetical protein